MEGIGSEVSHKIRAAIKAKLIELGAYIDDELPDYIMVMVANKRSRQQMDDDLQLFLGSNTKTFTSWLHTVLQKLQEVTVANFDLKKDSQRRKYGKKKHSGSEDNARKSRKSSEEKRVSKKHFKKHKESKKLKKAKLKSRDKEKTKNFEKRETKTESLTNDKGKKLEKNSDAINLSNVNAKDSSISNSEKSKGVKEFDAEIVKFNEASGTTSFPSADRNNKFKNFKNEDCSGSNSSLNSHFSEAQFTVKNKNDNQEKKSILLNRTDVIEDEFNIEPLEPDTSKDQCMDENVDTTQNSTTVLQVTSSKSSEMTIKVPTRELLKEHDKIHSESEMNVSKEKRISDEDSEESLSPEEIRKQLLLSRAKRKLEQSKLADRMKSNSPDVQILQNNSTGKQEDQIFLPRQISSSGRSSQRRDCDEEEQTSFSDSGNGCSNKIKLNIHKESRKISPIIFDEGKVKSQTEEKIKVEQKKKLVMSKSLETEKKPDMRSEDYKKSKNKITSSPKKKPVSSRIVTIPEPETPEIPSIVKVKPREYISKDKQANKALILKAVADAEKSIATVHSRNDSDIDGRKSKALFTKNLRGKRYEKLAVTLSNVQGNVIDRDKTKRMVSVDSENTNAFDRKTESLQDSELSPGLRSRPELTLKNISNKSEDQFISSKTCTMEKNDKYIHCWLEGVEQAVKDDEIVNPSEIDDFVHTHFSDEGIDDESNSINNEERRKKRSRSDEVHTPVQESLRNRRSGENNVKPNQDDGPQIVVTLDGLTSNAIKEIILRNRDAINGPLLVKSPNKKTDRDMKNAKHHLENEQISRFTCRNSNSKNNACTSRDLDTEDREKARGFEKISERFGRINKTSEIHEYKEKYYEFERERYEKKYLKYQGTEKEKHYEKLKDKYANAGESKNKKLIARLSEKFGKVDREFENKKRKYSDEDVRYSYSGRRIGRSLEKDGKYKKFDRKSARSEQQLYRMIIAATKKVESRRNCWLRFSSA